MRTNRSAGPRRMRHSRRRRILTIVAVRVTAPPALIPVSGAGAVRPPGIPVRVGLFRTAGRNVRFEVLTQWPESSDPSARPGHVLAMYIPVVGPRAHQQWLGSKAFGGN